MSTDVMVARIAESPPRLKARVAGLLYLIIFVTAAFSEFFVRGRLIVHGDAGATATNILAHEPLYRLGGAAEFITLACDAAVALLFYDLLKPVSRSLSLLAASFRLLFVAIMGVNLLNYFAPLVLLGGAHFLTVFTTDQLQALALVSHSLYSTGYGLSIMFFAFHCILAGYLIFGSAFFPRILGALLAIAGLCYLTNSFANVLAPASAGALWPYLMLPGAVAELSLTLWLLVMGVNAQRWKEQASAARSSDGASGS